MKNEFIFITGSQMTCRGVGVQMFMNMNFEWIASFPGRDNYCGLFQFPGTLWSFQLFPDMFEGAEAFPQFSHCGY